MPESNLIPATTKDVRAALKSGTVLHVWGDGMRAAIDGVRTKGGGIQVKHAMQGVWITPGETSRLVKM
jgi:hypothetical protein